MTDARTLARKVRAAVEVLRLGSVARQVRAERLTYLSPQKLARIERAVAETRGMPGDVLEFGVALGGSGILLAKAAAPRRFRGFDVFAMIPPPTSDKDDAKSRERYRVIEGGGAEGIDGDAYYGYRPDLLGDVLAAFARHGVPADGGRVALHQGLFEDAWPGAGVGEEAGAVSLAHIDCDWYDPVRYCLGAVADRLAPGGVLVIDDYNDYGGARTAVDEFLRARPDYRFEPGANPFLRRAAA